jgi:hypothetical protein
MTGFVAIMWAIWGVLVVTMLALKLYTGRLSRDEDDQLILDDAFDHLKNEQAAIIAKVNKVSPCKTPPSGSVWRRPSSWQGTMRWISPNSSSRAARAGLHPRHHGV